MYTPVHSDSKRDTFPHNNTAPAANGTAHSPNLARFTPASLLSDALNVKLIGKPGYPLHCKLKNVAYVSWSSVLEHLLGSSFLMLSMTFVFLQRQAASVMEQPEAEMALMIVLTPLKGKRVSWCVVCETVGRRDATDHCGGEATPWAPTKLTMQLRATYRKRMFAVDLLCRRVKLRTCRECDVA